MTRQLAAAVAVSAMLAGVASAADGQNRPGGQRGGEPRPADQRGAGRGPVKWWDAYRAELRLTPEQYSRISAIFEVTFPLLKASVEELNKREQQLSTLISADDATEAQVVRQAEQIETIRSELSKTRVLMLFRMRRVLSPEQRDKLQAMQKEHERGRGEPPPRR